jgi:predicted nucleic acid-binding Zn ribbon protein
MPNYCPECGVKLPNPGVKFCSECGAKIASVPNKQEKQKRFINCPSCGALIDSTSAYCPKCTVVIKPDLIETKVYNPNPLVTKPVSESSRLSGLKIEKYLMSNEIPTYKTKGSLYVGGEANMKGYVTNKRVLFFKSTGLIFTSDRLNEIPLDKITYYKIIEQGIVFKEMYFQLNELKIKGDRSDILGLYRAIQDAQQR